MPRKFTSQSYRFSPEDHENMQHAAEILHAAGIPGMLQADNTANKTALMRYLAASVASGEMKPIQPAKS